LIAELIPGMEPVADIGRTKREFHIAGRHMTSDPFPTPSGKAIFHAVPVPPWTELQPNQLRLMSVRSEGQFNTVVYDDDDRYRGQDRRDIILMHPDDMTRMGLSEEQAVRVQSAVGEVRYQRVRPFDVRPENALMYCPEANPLIPRDIDPESRTPAFKNVLVTITPES